MPARIPPGRPVPFSSPAAMARVKVLHDSQPKGHKPNPAGPFANLTWDQRKVAEAWLWKFCKRWEGNLPNWRRAILIGVAKRLALHPVTPRWGLRMLCARSGYGLARKCRELGIEHPGIAALNRAREWKRAGRPPLPSRQLPL